jgi:hypothetical protein
MRGQGGELMPTLAQLRAEPWWDREIVTDEVRWLGAELCRRTGRPADAFGCKGNEAHLSGSHRSQEWLTNSRYCTNRTGTGQAGLTALQSRYCAGIDFTPGSAAEMVAQCRRIYDAMRAGQLDEVRWFYGNLDGDRVVDGWNNVLDRVTTSDSSHLWHWHLGVDRRLMNSRPVMEKLLAVVLGANPKEDRMLVIAKDNADNSLWLCDGVWSRPLAADQVAHVRHLAGSGAIGPLWKGGEVWAGWVPAFGQKTTDLDDVLAAGQVKLAEGVAAVNAAVAELRELVGAGGTDPAVLEQAAFDGAQRAERE